MLTLLKEALEARDTHTKEIKFKTVREAALSLTQNDLTHQQDDTRYLLACLDAKGLGLPRADYGKAGDWLVGLTPNYQDANQPFLLHAEDLARITECHIEAAKYIFNNPLFCERIVPEYLGRIAETNETIALYLLTHPTFSKSFDAFDLARVGAASPESAKLIFTHPEFYEKLDSWALAWLGEALPDNAKTIFAEEKFSEKLDGNAITKIAGRYKSIAKWVIEQERLANKLQPDQLQRLKSMVEK